MIFLPLIALLITWDDPDNEVGNVAGYNIYRLTYPGTGEIIREKLNTDLIPWQEDGPKTPSFLYTGRLYPGDIIGGTAVAYDGLESEVSYRDQNFIVPSPPAAVPALIAIPYENYPGPLP